MKVNGKMICKRVMEWKHEAMDLDMKGITKEERNTEKVHICGQMVQNTLEIGLKIGYLVLVSIPGLTVEDMKAIG